MASQSCPASARGTVVGVVRSRDGAEPDFDRGRITDAVGLATLPVQAGAGFPDLPVLPAEVTVVFLPQGSTSEADAVHALTGLSALTGPEAMSVSVVAEVLTALVAAGRPPAAGRVVVIGAETVPELAGLLMAAGVRDVTVWNGRDAALFPLDRVIEPAHVVVDLLGLCEPTDTRVLRAPLDPTETAPGLVRALALVPGRRPGPEVLCACALTLVLATATHGTRHGLPTRELADRVTDTAVRMLRTVSRHQGGGGG